MFIYYFDSYFRLSKYINGVCACMNAVKVDGLPISKLKENYIVLVIQHESEFHAILQSHVGPVFIDDQKAYAIQDRHCFVYFHRGRGIHS